MPAKNSIKTYSENSYYHIYNRGVEKRKIFCDEQDYSVFLSYLKTYLIPKDEKKLNEILLSQTAGWREKDQAIKLLRLNNFTNRIILCAYCLMFNHFHFLIRQKSKNDIDLFMNSLGTRYTMYFNKKYKRIGSLCQDVFKAVMIESDEQLIYLSAYIHRNPLVSQGDALQSYLLQPSSLPEYIGKRKTEWLHSKEILAYFSKKYPHLDYLSFIKQTDDFSLIENALIDI